MTTLSQTARLAKKYGPLIGASFLIIVFSVLTLIRFYLRNQPQRPPEALPQPAIFQDQRQKQPLAFNFPDVKSIQFPKQLPIYTENKIDDDPKKYQEVATSLGFLQGPVSIENTIEGKQYNWQQSNLRLSINQTTLRYINNAQVFSSNKLTLPKLQAKASEFINKTPFVDKKLTLDNNQIKFINVKEEDFTSAGSLEEATLVEFNYYKILSSLPVYFGQPDAPFLTTRMTKDGTVTYFESRLYKDFTENNKYKLKSVDDAIVEIKDGKGKVIQTSLPDEQGNAFELYRIQPLDINTLDIKKIYLAFFISMDSTQLAQPIYVFEGEFNYSPNQIGKATIYLPAF